ncbi:MAG: flagellar hook capping protein [Candidatus Omnitrophica bacterium]|nr:flagellar hook capping protein [Candidatus Omnitrophota bacterium]
MIVNEVYAPPLHYRSAGESGESLGKNDFLQLLLTQMQNQDPLDPLKNEEFIAQLAQFNSLEQLVNLNTTMESMGTLQILTSSSSLIGRTVEAADGEDTVQGQVQEVAFLKGDIALQLDAGGRLVEVSIDDIVKVR